MIETQSVSFQYPGDKIIAFQDFSIKKGEHTLLLGESGSGKTTLLHLISGLLRGYKGSIHFLQQELNTLSESQLDQFRAQHIGFIFQKNHLISALTTEQNLMLAPYLATKKSDKERIHYLLNRLGLDKKKNANVKTLSQGQAQRVAIARALVNQPAVLFADEPTSALDDKNCDVVIDLLLEVANESKATLIMATHDQRVKNKISKQIILNS
jgi:ABC-type lipoprotein export system ATPase subunit